MKPPLLFLGWGNPSRGDDALGPLLCDRLEASVGAFSHFEVQQDFQLQVEDAMDIEGRAVVIFIDASLDGKAPFDFRKVKACEDSSFSTHALSPEAVLSTTCKIFNEAPPAYVLAVRGECFELGEPLSASAKQHLELAWSALGQVLAADEPLKACERWAETCIQR